MPLQIISRPRYSVPWGTLCHADDCQHGGNYTRAEASFDNVALCKECWRDHPEWSPGYAWWAPWSHRYKSRWPMFLRKLRYQRRFRRIYPS